MNSLLTLFTTYLIYPIIALLCVGLGALIAKKNKLLKNRRLIIYTLLSVLVLAIPALLGFLNYSFMPYAYIVLVVVYFIAGWYNDRLLPWVFNEEELPYRTKIFYILFQLVISMLLFALVFNLCNELKFGFWASTTMLSMVVVSLIAQTYELFIHIPASVYKVWDYSTASGYSTPEVIDHSKLKVVMVELFKREGDSEPIRINAKVPEEMLFGDWIKLLFEDYNKKSAHSPIDVFDNEGSGWIFYTRSWLLAPRRYLDHELTVKINNIQEKHLIVAKRVKNKIKEL